MSVDLRTDREIALQQFSNCFLWWFKDVGYQAVTSHFVPPVVVMSVMLSKCWILHDINFRLVLRSSSWRCVQVQIFHWRGNWTSLVFMLEISLNCNCPYWCWLSELCLLCQGLNFLSFPLIRPLIRNRLVSSNLTLAARKEWVYFLIATVLCWRSEMENTDTTNEFRCQSSHRLPRWCILKLILQLNGFFVLTWQNVRFLCCCLRSMWVQLLPVEPAHPVVIALYKPLTLLLMSPFPHLLISDSNNCADGRLLFTSSSRVPPWQRHEPRFSSLLVVRPSFGLIQSRIPFCTFICIRSF